jgi:DHA2 family multidrug resistance protein
MLGLIMAIVDTSIVNVALSNMAGTLGASIDEIGWVATGYILAQVIVMPLNGWLTARFGRRNFYAACIVIFTVSSFLCGTATSVWQLVAYRVLQGIGGGALQPTAQAIMFESYPPEKRNGAMAIFGLGAMVGPAIGPTLGGYLVDNYSWPLIFWINLPIGIAAFFMTLAFIKDQSYVKRDTTPVDWIGLGLLAAGVGSLQYVLERGQTEDWFSSQTILIMAIISVGSIVAFIIRELNDDKPLVDLSVFRSRSFTGGNIIGIVSGFGLFGSALMMPLYFQNVLGFTAMGTGIALLPGAIATAISLPIAGRIGKWIDFRICIAFGLVVFALGCWLVGGLNQQASFEQTLWPRAIQGFAAGRYLPREDERRDRCFDARSPARRQPRYRDPAADRDARSRFRVRHARVRRHDGKPKRRQHDARRRQSVGDAHEHLEHGDAQRGNDRVQRRVPRVRDRVSHLDSDGLAAEIASRLRRRAGTDADRVALRPRSSSVWVWRPRRISWPPVP